MWNVEVGGGGGTYSVEKGLCEALVLKLVLFLMLFWWLMLQNEL